MSGVMARSEIPNAYEMMRQAESWIYEVVTNHRNRGFTTRDAIEQAALDLDVSSRKVRTFFHGEASGIALDEWRVLKSRFLAHLEAEAADLDRRADAARLRRRQLQMGL
jgi:hypothetical protein